MNDRQDARRMARDIADALYPLPPEDVPAEVIEHARSTRQRVGAEIEEALATGAEARLIIAYRRGAPVTLADYLGFRPDGVVQT
jgi:hypothetical protein